MASGRKGNKGRAVARFVAGNRPLPKRGDLAQQGGAQQGGGQCDKAPTNKTDRRRLRDDSFVIYREGGHLITTKSLHWA
jgi:hypothetical protein